MAISYNSQQLKGNNNTSSLLRSFIVALVFVVGFGSGYFVKPALASVSNNSLSTVCVDYAKLVLSGDYDKAYSGTNQELQDEQDKAAFAEALKDVKAPEATITSKIANARGNVGGCVISIDGLAAAEDGSTDGLITLSLVKGGSWLVSSIEIQ